MNTIELARKAGAFELHASEHKPLSLIGAECIENFRRMCIEDFVKGVDVEPATVTVLQGIPYYTATQMAAQRHKALEEIRPRNWTIEMSDAWHRAIPDLKEAFDALIGAMK